MVGFACDDLNWWVLFQPIQYWWRLIYEKETQNQLVVSTVKFGSDSVMCVMQWDPKELEFFKQGVTTLTALVTLIARVTFWYCLFICIVMMNIIHLQDDTDTGQTNKILKKGANQHLQYAFLWCCEEKIEKQHWEKLESLNRKFKPISMTSPKPGVHIWSWSVYNML